MNRCLSLVACLALTSRVAFAQLDSLRVGRVPIRALGQAPLGYLSVGGATPEDAAQLLAAVGGLGPRRTNRVVFTIGSGKLRPPVLFTPRATLHQLYFDDEGRLVLMVDGAPEGLPTSAVEFRAQFVEARETQREASWYELQVAIAECIWLVAVFSRRDERLESVGVAHACPKR